MPLIPSTDFRMDEESSYILCNSQNFVQKRRRVSHMIDDDDRDACIAGLNFRIEENGPVHLFT